MGLLLSKSEFSETEPSERAAFHSPAPTQIVSNGEFNPLPQTAQQCRVKERVKEIAQILSIKRLGRLLISALPIGLSRAAKQLAAEVIYRRRHLVGLLKARKYRGRHGMAMHLGCGNNIKDGWVNIDLRPEADLTLDARERLPFQDNTFSIIYSDNFLEHIDYPYDITKLLSECYRVLEPGGVHSFAVPDGEKVLRYYITREYADFAQAQKKWNPPWCRTQMDHVNYCMRQDGEHRWYYDEETMRVLLERVGFVEIQRREFDSKLDQEVRRVGSMYMQCAKPKR